MPIHINQVLNLWIFVVGLHSSHRIIIKLECSLIKNKRIGHQRQVWSSPRSHLICPSAIASMSTCCFVACCFASFCIVPCSCSRTCTCSSAPAPPSISTLLLGNTSLLRVFESAPVHRSAKRAAMWWYAIAVDAIIALKPFTLKPLIDERKQ